MNDGSLRREKRPFSFEEIEKLGQTYSISSRRRYCIERICRVWDINRSSVYYKPSPEPHRGRGKVPQISDQEVLEQTQNLLDETSKKGFHNEGYKKSHARLKMKGITVGKERLRRIMRENNLLCPQGGRNPRGPQVHDGTIISLSPNLIWGTDMTATYTRDNGKVHVWAVIDHFNSELLSIHVSKSADRHQAMVPINQAISDAFPLYEKDCGKGVMMRHDHGSQYMSHDFQKNLKFFGIKSSPSFVRTPEGNGIIERFFRTLKENCLWIEVSEDVESLQERLNLFKEIYNNEWILHRLGFKSPRQERENWIKKNQSTAA